MKNHQFHLWEGAKDWTAGVIAVAIALSGASAWLIWHAWQPFWGGENLSIEQSAPLSETTTAQSLDRSPVPLSAPSSMTALEGGRSSVNPAPVSDSVPAPISAPVSEALPREMTRVVPRDVQRVEPSEVAAPVMPVVPPAVSQMQPQRVQPIVLQPQIYLLRTEGEEFFLEPKAISLDANLLPEAALRVALEQLFSTPTVGHAVATTPLTSTILTSTIPAGSRLLALAIDSTGVYVDLSSEFASGGGSTSMIYRVGQVVFTATSLDPKAKVFLSVEGQPLDENHPLGGEGLLLQYPTTRQSFSRDFLAEAQINDRGGGFEEAK
jgi:spore germination protein GerM